MKLNKKRGVLLVISLIILSLIILNTYSAPSDIGCCIKPNSPSSCEMVTEETCCEDDPDCIGPYFRSGVECTELDECQDKGCCYACCENYNYSDYRGNDICSDSRWQGTQIKEPYCPNPNRYWEEESCGNVSACDTACCQCVTDIGNLDNATAEITTQAGCGYKCNQQGYSSAYWNESITSLTECEQIDITVDDDDDDDDFVQDEFEKGNLTGFITTTAGDPISNAEITLMSFSQGLIEAATTAETYGSYFIEDIWQGSYILIATHPNYFSNQINITINETNIEPTADLALQYRPTGTISGKVENDKGQELENALIFLDNVLVTVTNSQGEYTIITDPGDYQIYASASYHISSSTREINLLEYHTISEDFTLTSIDIGCLSGRKVSSLTASNIKGREGIELTWPEPNCNNLVGYYLFRNNTLIEYFDSPKTFYLDYGVEWEKTYQYSIKAVYDSGGLINSTPTNSSSINTGDGECEGKYIAGSAFTQFCDSHLRKTCNNQNRVNIIENCSDIGDKFFCAGPDDELNTVCKNQGNCYIETQDAVPFGLYYDINTCHANENYCYYDYSQTIVDSCFNCSQDMTCFDYESSAACNDDNCIAANNSNCDWVETVFSEMGKGLCYQEDYNGTDQCWRCSLENDVFENQDCTQDICSKLGNCYSDETNQNCGQCSTCEALSTPIQCTGEDEQSFEIDEDYQFTPSKDQCSLGKCKWSSSNACFKDGDDDDIIDCDDTDIVCKEDFTPPTTTLPQKPIILKNESSLTFTSEPDATLYYCIDSEETCSPQNTAHFSDSTLTLSADDLREYFRHRNGEYHIRFYSIDQHNNQEEIKTRKIFADVIPPEITITYQTIEKPEQGVSDINFNIQLTEEAVCTDRLFHSEDPSIFEASLLSEQEGSSWNILYSDIQDGPYKYELKCFDFAGNKKTFVLDKIVLDASGYISIESPLLFSTTKETDILFNVTTPDKANCVLLKGESIEDQFNTDSNQRSHYVEKENIPSNHQYFEYKVKCTDVEKETTYTKWFTFTIDQQPPNTSITIHTEERENPTKRKSGWELWFNNPVDITFNCNEQLPDSFGCEKVRYCISETSSCTPQSDDVFGGQPRPVTDTSYICYYSKDQGGNQENTKCGIINIGEALGIDLVNPPYEVSNIPIFDVEIETARPTVQCRFWGINPRSLPFESQGETEFHFNPMDSPPTINHILYNFPGAQSQPYDMYIKCKDPAGFVNEDQPAHFKLEYDPFPPNIISLRTDPATVTYGNKVLIIAETDDKTVCKYHPTATDYNEMRDFELDWENDNPSFSNTSVQEITIPSLSEPTRFFYNIVCKNRAGDISQPRTLSYLVNYKKSGYIKSTSPSGSLKNTSVILRAETSKPASCRYKDLDNIQHDFSTEDTINHFSEAINTTAERVYTYPITCEFSAFPRTRTITGQIQFTIDRTAPEITNINDGDYSCGKEIYPQFEADDLSGISYYNYSVYEFDSNNLTLDWQTTSSSNPTISIDSLELGEKYYLKVFAVDNPGNIGTEKISNGFIADDENSTACIRDQNPPEVTIEKEITYQGVKVTIVCEDETGCKQKFYSTSLNETDCNATEYYSDDIYITETRFFCWKASDVAGNTAAGSEKIIVNDSDIDGVPDQIDECLDTPAGESVNEKGCGTSERFVDRDNDNVPDNIDNCLDTPIDEVDLVDEFGCAPSERDADEDGVIDDEDKCPGTPFGEAVDTEGCSDSQKDSDDDGMDDAYEKRHNLDPFNPSDAQQDEDDDGLTNLEEYNYFQETGREISPRNKDTDDDGYSDKEEIEKGYNPVDAASKPKGKLFPWILIILGIILIVSGSSYLAYMEITKKPVGALPRPKIPKRPAPALPPRPSTRAPSAAPPAMPSEAQRKLEQRKKELKKRRKEIAEKRRKEKEKKRSKFFDIFGSKKKEAKIPKPAKEKPPKKAKPTKKPHIKKEEFERLNELTKEYKKGKKPLKSLLKIKKIPKGKKKEFEELKKLIKERPIPKERKRKLSTKKQKEVRELFSKLSQLKKEVKTKTKKTSNPNHKNPLKELNKLNKKNKKKKEK